MPRNIDPARDRQELDRANDAAPFFVHIAEAQRLLGEVGRTTIYGLVQKERLHFVKIGRRSVLSVAELRRLARQLEADAGVDVGEEAWQG